jgi:glycine cleavage system transcriptional repressor
MGKAVIAVLGNDRPGIIATVSKVLYEQGCNIEDVSQTILQTEFVGIFIATRPSQVSEETLLTALREQLAPKGLLVLLKPMEEAKEAKQPPSEPFVITTVGPDRPGLVAGITEVLARYGINITHLKAVFRGTERPQHNVMFYEVDMPLSIDQRSFRAALYERAHELGLEATLQHRDIFEQIHRV